MTLTQTGNPRDARAVANRHSHQKNPFLSPKVWLTYTGLFAVSIPWYWPKSEVSLWLGLPAWVIVTVLSSFVISSFTAWLIINRWPSKLPDEKESHD